MVFAKAKYSQNINGITPKINDHGYINIVNGKHPLLKGNVVPLNFEIGNTYRSLNNNRAKCRWKNNIIKNCGDFNFNGSVWI